MEHKPLRSSNLESAAYDHATRTMQVKFKSAGNVARHTLQRLDSFVDCISGKRITYKQLTAEVLA